VKYTIRKPGEEASSEPIFAALPFTYICTDGQFCVIDTKNELYLEFRPESLREAKDLLKMAQWAHDHYVAMNSHKDESR
jgi:hypothetical protein